MSEGVPLDRTRLEKLGVQTPPRTKADELMEELIQSKRVWTSAEINRLTDAIGAEGRKTAEAQLEILRRRQAESGE